MVAADREQNKITKGIFLELMAKDEKDKYHIAKVSLLPKDCHLTKFSFSRGRSYYKQTPQGNLTNRDAYTRRYDEIIIDIPIKAKFIEDTV